MPQRISTVVSFTKVIIKVKDMRKKVYNVFGILALVAVSFAGIKGCVEKKEYKAQVRDLQTRLAQATEEPEVVFVYDSVPVYRTKVVEVDKTDYKKQLADKKLIKELGLKVSQLESENQVLLNTKASVELDSVNDSVLCYSDKWIDFCFHNNSRILDCEVRDSLSTYIAREPKHKFLWFRWGTKGYNVSIVSHNPRCVVEYNKYIKVKK